MTVPSSRTAKKKPPPRRRVPPRKRRGSNRFLLVLALPVLSLLVFFGYRFLRAPELETSLPAAPAPTVAPSLVSRLRDAGIEKERIHSREGKVVVESFTAPAEVLSRLQKQMPGATLRLVGNDIEIRRGKQVDRVSIRRLQRGDRGDGLEALPEEQEEDQAPVADVVPVPARPDRGDKRIALIIDDVGFDRQPVEAAAALPGALSFAVIPGTPNARQSADLLSSHGHEILCHLPMEPNDYPRKSPGANAIFTNMPSESIRKLAADDVASIPHVRGLNNHMGSRATRDSRVMRDVLSVVKAKGLYFIDSRTIAGSVGESLARSMRVPTAGRDVFLDDVETAVAIRAQLRLLAAHAEAHGLAVGIGHIYPVTMQVLREEMPRLVSKGFRFIPASEAVR